MLGGTECGPTNPLQSLLKLQQDRGQYGQQVGGLLEHVKYPANDRFTDQDHFVPVAGSSTRADISQEEVRANREAEAFFQQAAGSKQLWDSAFDLKPLDHALAPFKGHQTLQPRDNWVKDFLKAQQQEPRFHPAPRSHSPASSSVNILRPLPQRQNLSPFSYQPVQPSACSEETALAHKYDQATSGKLL